MPIEHTVIVNATPAAVQAALTTTAGIQGWWAKDCDAIAAPGGQHALRFVKGDMQVRMLFAVDAVDAGHVRWTCTENANPVWLGSTLEWRWTRADGQTQLRFTHDNLKMAGSPPYQMTADGWQHFMGSLKAYVETGSGQPW